MLPRGNLLAACGSSPLVPRQNEVGYRRGCEKEGERQAQSAVAREGERDPAYA
jgi:hypothetical protein